MWSFNLGSFILGCVIAIVLWAPVFYGAEKRRKQVLRDGHNSKWLR